jgi:hypothetical protein
MSGSGADSASSASGGWIRTIQPGGQDSPQPAGDHPDRGDVIASLWVGDDQPAADELDGLANAPRSTSRSYSTRVQRRSVNGAWAMAVSVGSAPPEVNADGCAHRTALSVTNRGSRELRSQLRS